MEGYDTLLLGQFYAQPAFAKRFGELNPANNVYEIPTRWQTALGVSTQIGNILGLQLTGVLSERFGYRITMLVALIALTGFLFIQFFAVNLPMLLVGYLLLGFPWGTFQTMTVSYAAEVMPVRLRQYLTTYVNLCWVIGQIISSGVNRALVGNNTQWAYKIPFALQWMWCLPIGLRIALVVGQEGSIPRSRKVFDAIDRARLWIHRRRRQEDCCHDGPHQPARDCPTRGCCVQALFPGNQLATNRDRLFHLAHPEHLWIRLDG
jgi:SP family general alpha glucoside:H+ symporter-like MFS transporter